MADPAGTCPGCRLMFSQLDLLVEFGVEVEKIGTGADERAATLHVLAAVMSWWMDRSLARFPGRDLGLLAVTTAFANALGEHGIVIGGGPHG